MLRSRARLRSGAPLEKTRLRLYRSGVDCVGSQRNTHSMKTKFFLILLAMTCASIAPKAQDADAAPVEVDPGNATTAPSDAIALFTGSDFDQWSSVREGQDIQWLLRDGSMVVTQTGGIVTKQEFGSVQLHVEWATPREMKGASQGRGNSGVYLQGRYEIQVLDSYKNPTYPNGQAGALYGYFPPLVNVTRAPGEWQTYDIVFHPPLEGEDGIEPGSITVFHNGVLIQDHVPVTGTTTASPMKGAAAKGPLYLQDHGNPVRFRNIWIREIPAAH